MSFVGDAIESYHALLNDEVARETQTLLDEGQRREGLYFGTRPIVTVLRPHFLADEHLSLLESACRTVAQISRQVVDYALGRPDLVKRLAFTPGEQALMDIEPGYREWSVSARLDSFLDEANHSLQFVEYNAESPAAIAYGDVISELFVDLPVMRALIALSAARREKAAKNSPTS